MATVEYNSYSDGPGVETSGSGAMGGGKGPAWEIYEENGMIFRLTAEKLGNLLAGLADLNNRGDGEDSIDELIIKQGEFGGWVAIVVQLD